MKIECLMQMHICALKGTYSHEMLMKIVMHLLKTCIIWE